MSGLEALSCPKCGGTAADHEQSFCGYCGAALERTRKFRSPREEEQDRLARAEKEAPRISAIDRRAVTRRAPIGNTSSVLLRVLWGSLFVLGATCVPWWPVRLLLGGAALMTAWSAARLLLARVRYSNARLRRLAAVVRDERIHVSGDGEFTSTRYFVSIERRNGVRTEYPITAELAARVAPGDVGVAFLREDYLLDFVRVEQP